MNQSTFFNVSYCTDPLFKLNVLKKTTSTKCDICLMDDNNPVRYGEFVEKTYAKHVLRVHYFCMLTGTYIQQNASSGGTGIAGFLLRDILKSYAEYRSKSCYYCRHPSAPIECAQPTCGRRFHYICGYNNSCLSQFFGQYLSYCHQHVPAELCKPVNTKERDCDICYKNLPEVTDQNFNPLAIIRTHCSSECPAGLMHRECVQKFAYSSGYNFKCPLCWNNKFKTHAAESGIFIPERESAWEREPNAFKDLHKRKCTAVPCKVENAQQSNQVSELLGCQICGGQLMHKLCSGVTDENDYLCNVCMDDSFANLVQ